LQLLLLHQKCNIETTSSQPYLCKVPSKVTLTPAQCRAARALLGWSQQDLERTAHVAKKTIADFERGARNPFPRTLEDLIEALEAAGIEFTNPVAEVCGAGVRFKWGYEEPVRVGAPHGATSQNNKGGLDALEWDWDDYDPSALKPPPPLDWSDEDKRAQIEHWRSSPEAWAELHEVSRQCLLRAMGVDSLDAGDPAP
jgi:transcriptional regulator with XRE-family HTH domain